MQLLMIDAEMIL